MKGIILAAGRGSRMGSATDQRPKCLTVLAGKTLLDWQIEALKASGVHPLAAVTGYQAEALQDSRYSTFHNPRWTETNMVLSLATAAIWLREEPCIVSYGDIVYHPEIVKQLCFAEGDIVITYDRLWQSLWAARFPDPLADAESFEVDEHGRLLEIGQDVQSLVETKGQYMGLFKITPNGWDEISSLLWNMSSLQRDKLDMTALLNLLLKRSAAIRTVAVDGRWCEVDSVSDLNLYEETIQQDGTWPHDWRFT